MTRRRGSVRAALALLAVVLTAGAGWAQEETYGAITVRALPVLGEARGHGYVELAFAVSNAGDQPRLVTLVSPATPESRGRRQTVDRIERTVLVGARSEARVALFLPPVPVAGSGLEVSVDGERRRPILPLAIPEHPAFWMLQNGSGPVPQVLFSPRFRPDDFGVADTDLGPTRTELPEAAWSETWLGYGGWDGIVVSGEALEAASPGVRDALRRVAAVGGNVTVFGGRPGLLLDADREADLVRGTVRVYFEGFGRILTVPDGDMSGLETLREAWKASVAPWTELTDPSAFLTRFQVIEGLTVPVRGLVLAIIVLTLVMGPINVGYLRHIRRPTWIFWTVPALAFLACATVLVWAFASEGLQRLSRTVALTVLDQPAHDATTLAFVSYYSTLQPGPLTFDAATELTPMIRLGWNEGGETSRRLDWSEGQRLTSGWVSPRLPAGFVVRKSEPRRERLEARREADGTLTVTNGLGGDLVELWVADREGRLHRAEEPVAAGSSVTLLATPRVVTGTRADLHELFGLGFQDRLAGVRTDPSSTLWAGTYLAVLETAPFIEPGLERANGRRAESFVLGLLGEEI